MKKLVIGAIALLVLTGCPGTTVRCGPGTLASPDGVDADGSGFMVSQDGTDYVDGNKKRYKNVTCKPVQNPLVCGPNTVKAPAEAGDKINPDGGGLFVNQDGSGLLVNQDGSVPANEACVIAVRAPEEQVPTPP